MSSGPWSSPQTPLSPHRLAKIANALGVPTPVPASPARTPPPTSSYLVHVVPPLILPHLNSSLTSPPLPTASGYHAHFRRGTLLPVHATLQLQLAAIAREYALPSTSGLTLYLVQDDDPGPRISEDIWRHLWARVWKVEFAPEAPQKLPTLTLSTPKSERVPSMSVISSSPERANVPIVAKVEFDIDARAAAWFNPWITSRNLNYNKRLDSNNSPINLTLLEKHPPRLLLETFGNSTNSSGSFPSTSTSLAYLQQPESSDDDTEIEEDVALASGKRGGGVFDDIELDFDESFEHSQETQFLLTAQLDQIEKNLAQFSPRVLSIDLEEEQTKTPSVQTDLPPPSPINPTASWPAVPFTSLNSPLDNPNSNTPSPPRLAVNGITTSAPKSFNPTASANPSAETNQRRKQLEEDEWAGRGQYPHLTPTVNGSDSVIPLSPDPFGRFSSSTTPPPDSRGSTYWDDSSSTAVDDSKTTSSRFSADSIKGEPASNPNRATIMSVKSIRRLWRRSSKQSISLQQQMPLPPGRLSPNGEPVAQHRSSSSTSSNRNSLQQGAAAPPVKPTRPSTRPPSLRNFDIPDVSDPVPTMFPPKTTIGFDRLRFDQESPYPNPTRRARPPVNATYPAGTTAGGKDSPTLSTSGKSSPTPPPQPENPRNSVRKSILKWKSSSSGSRSPSTSMLSANNSERPSVEKMPPSPRIPEQFLQQQQTGGTHATTKSISSIAPSMISVSKSVRGRGPSIDESQFEMVSPKMATNSLTYPYTTVDRDEDQR
ncbi:hypothetical protein BDZ89DRAFT_1064958 [Hymenopellis radicata]|nr:hypothetical protein BDZ89DRAFT_1064958 [Hymenopellis radicata]